MAIILPITVFLLFYLFKRRLGSPTLASIAGALVYNLFIEDILRLASSFIPTIPGSYIQFFVLCFFILLLPLILYLRQSHSHSTGLYYQMPRFDQFYFYIVGTATAVVSAIRPNKYQYLAYHHSI